MKTLMQSILHRFFSPREGDFKVLGWVEWVPRVSERTSSSLHVGGIGRTSSSHYLQKSILIKLGVFFPSGRCSIMTQVSCKKRNGDYQGELREWNMILHIGEQNKGKASQIVGNTFIP